MLLADSNPSPPVTAHQLFTGWQFSDHYALAAFAFQVLALVWYLGAVRRMRDKGRTWSTWRTASYLSGVLVLTIAVVSGLASYDDQVFTVHVIQHLLLMMVAPPLLSMGAPVTLAIQAAKRPMQTRIIRVLHNPVLRFLTMPLVAAALYYGSMYAGFLTSFYPYALTHHLVHNIDHVTIFVFGCLFWWPMLGVDELPNRPAFQFRLIAMFVGMPLEVFLGLALMNFSKPIAPEHTLSGTHAGGALFWGASMLITFAAALIMLAQWMRREEREAARNDRQPDVRERRRLTAWEAAWQAKRGPVGIPIESQQTPAKAIEEPH